MNLPPRLGDIRMLANKLHLYGGDEEQQLLNAANHLVAGLPLPVDQMPAEEQLMMMGLAKSNIEAALMVASPTDSQVRPQLYSAPDPEEDPEALRHMEHLALLAVQAQNVVATGNVLLNATRAVLNHTRDFFLHGVLPQAGLDELDEFLLKKIGMISHCGFEQNMRIVANNITDELMCAMRVHLMNESEMNIFCPQDVKAWDENCHEVEFMNFTAISETNELGVLNALRTSIKSLLSAYPTSAEEDRRILASQEMGPIRVSAVTVRLHEKDLLVSALTHLESYEDRVRAGTVPFQLDLKIQERSEVRRREAAHQKFLEEIRIRLEQKVAVATVAVEMGPELPKQNLTVEEGQDIKEVVRLFCVKHGISMSNAAMLEQAARARVVNPPLLSLFMGVVTPLGQRKILAIPEGANATVETNVFCAKYNITSREDCAALQERVETRLNTSHVYHRRVVLSVPIDALDGRKLYLIIREGEQHDVWQHVTDFFTLYYLPLDTVPGMVQEVNRRLPGTVLAIPVSLQAAGQRGVSLVLAANDNITNVVEGFIGHYGLDRGLKVELMKRALYGMAPGSYLV